MNQINIIGRLTKDVESRTTTTGTELAEITVACDKRIKPKEQGVPTADFFKVRLFGQQAKFIAEYAAKGRLIAVSGRIESRRYNDRDGVSREVWEVIADQAKLLDRPKEDQPNRSTSSRSAEPDPYDPFADEA